jgi:polysaccharide pyruvyl transferase WcaK-like protein
MFKKTDAYLVGYYGMRNSGDDALMYATAWGAKNLLEYNNITLGLYGDHSRHNPANHQLNLQFKQKFSGQNRLAHYQEAFKSNSILFGGGAVLHSQTDINLKRHLMMLAGASKSAALGVSLGPFQSIAAEKSCAKFLNECGYVGVRDQNSLAIANSIAPNAKVEKTFDLAPLLLCSDKYKPSQRQRKGIALALCPVAVDPMGKTNQQSEEKRITEICQLITSAYQSTGESITLLTFNGHPTLGDWMLNNQIMARLHSTIPLTIKPYNPNPYAVLEDIASYKAIISMRLHGAILGYLANTPVLSLNYHEKCIGWCHEVGLSESYQINLAEQNILDILTPLEQGLMYGFSPPTLAVTKAIKMALSNWSINHEQTKFHSRYTALQQS